MAGRLPRSVAMGDDFGSVTPDASIRRLENQKAFMTQIAIQPDDNRTGFEPGETISALIEWSLADQPDSIELRVVWNTVGKGTTDVGIEHAIMIDSPNQSDSRRVDVPLPKAPYSFSGKLVSLVWALELVVSPSGESYRREITIAPGGSEVELQRSSEHDDAGAGE